MDGMSPRILITSQLSHLSLGLSVVQVGKERGPDGCWTRWWGLPGSDSLRVVWPEPLFLGVWVVSGLQRRRSVSSRPELILLAQKFVAG